MCDRRSAPERPGIPGRDVCQRKTPTQPPDDLVGRQPVDIADVVAQVGQAPRLGREGRDTRAKLLESLGRRRLELLLAPLSIEHREDGRPQGAIVRGRHEMKGRAHERALYEVPSSDGRVERRRLEPGHPCPQADVRRGRFLGLQPADAADRIDDVEMGRFEQELASERRAVQSPCAQDLGHALHSRGRSPARNVAISSV